MYWTDIKDGLPNEDHFECLMVTSKGIRLGEFTIDGCFHKIVEESSFGGSYSGEIFYKWDNTVTHWMPAPRLPDNFYREVKE